MKKLSKYCIILFTIVLSSCGKSIPTDNIIGITEYYESFLFHKYEPVIMTQTLEFDFNEDAKHYIKSDILLEVVKKDKDGNIALLEGDIKVYQNGQLRENNVIAVSPNDKTIELGIEFTPEAEEGYYNLYLRERGNKQLDEIDLIDIEDKMYVNKDDIYNPLALYSTIGLIILLISMLIWYILSRFIFWTSVPFGRVLIDYNDGYGDTTIKMNGKYELVLTNDRKMKDSFFSKLLKGSRQYEYNDFWEHKITIKKGYRNKLSITGLRTFNVEGEKVRREPFYIENDKSVRVKIETT